MPRPSTLPAPARELVLQALQGSNGPMTAYALLERLQVSGIKSAPIIYRALKALEKSGDVHKIHALNSFIACNCGPDHTHSLSVLTICQRCARVEELHDHEVIHHLDRLRAMRVPLPGNAVIELPVICGVCA